VFEVFAQAYEIDLSDPGAWEERRSLFDHLADTAAEFWLAEEDGAVVGYGRSIHRDGMRELTEFFVVPGRQARGIGTALLERALPADHAGPTAIVASLDPRALQRYLKAGMRQIVPLLGFIAEPRPGPMETDLTMEPVVAADDGRREDVNSIAVEAMRRIDLEVLGHARDQDHRWLLSHRRGFLYRRRSEVVGYGYVGERGVWQGPFALLEPTDVASALAHAEGELHGAGEEEILFEVPSVNHAAVEYLLSRKYQVNDDILFLMTNRPFGHFDRYVLHAPPFFF
jgi:GNAT superfamily N-acetyltransferase